MAFKINPYLDKLRELCSLHHVSKLYIFGSATHEAFNDQSDIDFLVRFKDFERKEYFKNYTAFKEQLHQLFKRNIDLVEEQTLSNKVLTNSINNSKKLIYG